MIKPVIRTHTYWMTVKEYNKMCINSLKCFNREFSREAVKKDFNEILKL